MNLQLQALGFGLFSALSLPIGAALGILLSPVSEVAAARWMAFGAGALVFAVATQLYGEALAELLAAANSSKARHVPCGGECETRLRNLMWQNAMGILGALLYFGLERWLAQLSHKWMKRARQRPSATVVQFGESTVIQASEAPSSSSASGSPAEGPIAALPDEAGRAAEKLQQQQQRDSGASQSSQPRSVSFADGTGASLHNARQPMLSANSRTVTVAGAPLVHDPEPDYMNSHIAALSHLRRAKSFGASATGGFSFIPGISFGTSRAATVGGAARSEGGSHLETSIVDEENSGVVPYAEVEDEEDVIGDGGSSVAISMWLGLLLDGIPESLMLGFMTNEGSIGFEFLVAIFIANFPEAFSGASLLIKQGMSTTKVFAMWTTVFVVTGLLALVGSWIMPDHVEPGSTADKVRDFSTACMEGLTGGAMLAMISTAMLPEAYRGAGEPAGLLFVLGFALSILLSCLGARFGGPQELT
mmetsp:Transcript_55334/g.117975  ORF Transcript_55334/g.117975 Transcript_55334/m.117975 type:complete len:476 (+) Transcript_55334:187-1614(+)|eukprot:CAMPEP_0206484880 /NCGR_PEP_ID=MMETSP0324_2-20121206/40214_1 /ASSEMBLY_ACC=CAM_ASM_000836 /TAXON_ID=2866 /ORGANISM="Crypthecodinium cohnii, Strain Seligo" /LENGTH=475 /DNA_ID=CAMNT_0053963065 /DNA_START=122 /DNA_END=1549 /DNA_ORIENTATION=+